MKLDFLEQDAQNEFSLETWQLFQETSMTQIRFFY